jgi:carbamoyl-phosphate synthase large subunit
MEINPRLGGGVVCSMHAGAPLSEYLFKESKGIGVEECKDWKDNLFITRYFKEVVFHGK